MRAPSSLYRPDPAAASSAGCNSLHQPLAPAPNKAPRGLSGGGQRAALKLAGAPAKLVGPAPQCQPSHWQQAGYGCGPDCDEDATSECSCSLDPLECQPGPHNLDHIRYSPSHLRQHHHSQPPMHHPQYHQHHHQQHLHQHPQQQQQQQQQQHLTDSQTSDECAFIQNNSHRQHHHLHHHQLGRPASAGSLSPPPPPAPLVRQSTYTTAPDTITDSSIILGHNPQQQRNGCAPPTSDFLHPTSDEQRVNGRQGNYGTLHGGAAAAAKYQAAACKQRQSVSFRRSNTLGGPSESADDSRIENAASSLKFNAANNNNNNNNNIYAAEDRLLLVNEDSNTNTNAAAIAGGGSGSKKPTHNNKQPGKKKQTGADGDPAAAGQFARHNVVGPPCSDASPVHAAHLSPTPGATYPPGSPTRPGFAPNARGINRYLYPGSLWSFDSAALPAPLVPPATSHRTNSSWMRISSIILAPIGLVIILFIVVSPLLHYLM